jgi:hypothetical protein
MVLRGIFQANTELTASEILDKKTQPDQLAKMVQGLRHRPARGVAASRTPSHGAAPARQHTPATTGGFADMDDDIPFNDPMKNRAYSLSI